MDFGRLINKDVQRRLLAREMENWRRRVIPSVTLLQALANRYEEVLTTKNGKTSANVLHRSTISF